MYGIELNQEQAEMLENELSKEAFYIGIGITQLFGYEEGVICGIIDSVGIEGINENDYLKSFKKSKIKRAVEHLLCCGILNIENGKLVFNKDRYIEMNNLGAKIEKEKHYNYKGVGTYEDVLKYEEMVKYVDKMFD